MRIAIVSDYFLDYVGGAQSSILEQQASLKEAGHEVFLISTARALKGNVREVRGAGLQIKPAFTVPGVLLPVVAAKRRLINTLKEYFTEQHLDVVHLQTEFGLAHAATTAAHELGLPVVHTVHTLYWQSSGIFPTLAAPAMRALLQSITGVRLPDHRFTARPSDNLLRNLTVAMAQRADVVISPSAHQGADLQSGGVSGLIDIVPNPIARSHRPAALVTAEQAAAPRILWVARCEPEKRPLVFAEAVLAALARTNNGFAVDLVGDGSELAQVRALAEGHPQLVVHGGLGHERVLELMDASSLVALTSNGFDNQPMTIAESVSRYRGVLFCDAKLREGLGDSGYLTETPDVTALADAIVELVTEPERLVALSVGAQKDSREFAASTYVERVVAVYTRAAELRGAAA